MTPASGMGVGWAKTPMANGRNVPSIMSFILMIFMSSFVKNVAGSDTNF